MDNRESGVCVAGAGAVELADTRLANNQHGGLAVGGVGSRSRALRCTLSGNLTTGAGVYMGAAAELLECSAHSNATKSVHVGDDGSSLRLGRSCSLDRQPSVVNGGLLVRM